MKIFFNYRREDDPSAAGRLFDRLEQAFETDGLFMDVVSIDPGTDFVEVLDDQLARCDVVLAVIGRRWLDIADAEGRQRLQKPDDYVRMEIELALKRQKRLIPVLVNNAQMPRSDDLPHSLKPLARLNALPVSHANFGTDTGKLIEALKSALVETTNECESVDRQRRPGEPKDRRVRPVNLTPGTIFRDVDEPWCPEMVVIPAGRFMMGPPHGEENSWWRLNFWKDQIPQREVVFAQPFALGRCPVTFEEYDYFCKQTGRWKVAKLTWDRGRRPVTHVLWTDAQAYCKWLSEVTQQSYHLPTEAEWEYGCRAGTTTRYSFGDQITPQQANFGNNVKKTTEVGSYPANRWGLHDMHGNVDEFVEDSQNKYKHFRRGGAWLNASEKLRSASRSSYFTFGEQRWGYVGFRAARTLSIPASQ